MEAVFFSLFSCFDKGGFNLLSRVDSPSKKTPTIPVTFSLVLSVLLLL